MRAGNRRPRDPRDIAALEPVDPVAEISGWIKAVCIHTRHEFTPGLGKSHVQSIGRTARGIIDQTHACIHCRKALEHLARAISRPAFGENELDFALLQTLGEHRGHRRLEHRGLVQHWRQDADGHRWKRWSAWARRHVQFGSNPVR